MLLLAAAGMHDPSELRVERLALVESEHVTWTSMWTDVVSSGPDYA